MSQSDRLLGRTSKPKRKVGQRAVLNGKKVMWDGKKWVPAPNHSRSSSSSNSQSTRLSGNKPKPKKKTGNTVSGQANLTKQRERLDAARSHPRYSRTPTATKPTTTKPPASKPTTTKPTTTKPPAAKPPAKKSAVSTYKKHGSDLHIGRHKTLAQHRAAVAERKKKKKPQSNANKAGWQGNRNY